MKANTTLYLNIPSVWTPIGYNWIDPVVYQIPQCLIERKQQHGMPTKAGASESWLPIWLDSRTPGQVTGLWGHHPHQYGHKLGIHIQSLVPSSVVISNPSLCELSSPALLPTSAVFLPWSQQAGYWNLWNWDKISFSFFKLQRVRDFVPATSQLN